MGTGQGERIGKGDIRNKGDIKEGNTRNKGGRGKGIGVINNAKGKRIGIADKGYRGNGYREYRGYRREEKGVGKGDTANIEDIRNRNRGRGKG